jgi:flagellar motor switch protein FliN
MPDDLFSTAAAAATGAVEPSPFASVGEESAVPGDGDEARPGEVPRLDLVMNIPVRLSVELGRAELPIREVVNVGRGSVIELDRNVGEPLDVRVNGVLIGHGEIVVIDEERLGLRFVDVVSRAERVSGLK